MLPKVLILYTGGTFGMTSQRAKFSVPSLRPNELKQKFLERVPELSEIAQCEVKVLMNLDSSHIGPPEWGILAQAIRQSWGRVDGVVLLHGTDTLAYTASALTFLLGKCPKPVVLTGAMRPLSALRTDARRNLLSAVEIAAQGPRPFVNRVSVFFDHHLFEGHSIRKRSASEFDAFESPYADPLAEVGTEIRYRTEQKSKRVAGRGVRSPRGAKWSSKIAVLHLTPGVSVPLLSALVGMEGILLVGFPSGTGPTQDPLLCEWIKKLKVPVVLVSQEPPTRYKAGQVLADAGVTWAGPITLEAAYVKMSLILGQSRNSLSLSQFKSLWARAKF